MPLTWKDWVKQAVGTGGTGALVLGAASSGFQAFVAGDDGKLFPYSIQDGTAWETGYGTYTNAGTTFTRTSRTDSSTGAALNVSTSAFLFVDVVSNVASYMGIATQGILPGGRLTLVTGVPVTTADVTAAPNLFYTPYLHNVICLWDGNIWIVVTFAQVTQAIGTITSALPYDVFGFLSAGALSTEILAWSTATARATAITLQDGRYCKSGDKTRLYLGTFYTTSTTTTEDSKAKRFVWNMYNREPRTMFYTDTTASWTYALNSWRQARAQTASRVEVVAGLDGFPICLSLSVVGSIGTNGEQVAFGVDSTTVQATNSQGSQGVAGSATSQFAEAGAEFNDYVAVGYHAYNWLERISSTGFTGTFYGALIDTNGGNGGGYTNGIGGIWAC